MGHRLHVAKTYKVEYAGGSDFNYRVEQFHNLLSELGIDYSGDAYDDDFEVAVEAWENGIKRLRNLDAETEEVREDIIEAVKALNDPYYPYVTPYDPKSVATVMEELLKEADTDSGYIHLSFF